MIKLQTLSLCNNQITKIKDNTFKSLINLQTLHLTYNLITKIKDNAFISLIELEILYLDNNQITNIHENTFNSLANLYELHINNNQLTTLPMSLLNCERLYTLTTYGNELVPNIRMQRFVDRMNNYNNHGIFNDTQNVHNNSIQKSTKESINNLMKDDTILTKYFIIDELIKINPKCLQSLLCYLEDNEIHSTLLLTFNEVFIKVSNRIINNEYKDDLIKRLDEEMQESECKCFTGRITRLVNVLCGYFDDVNITISNNERISAIILSILNGEEMCEELKEQCRKQLKENDFSDDEIDKWLN